MDFFKSKRKSQVNRSSSSQKMDETQNEHSNVSVGVLTHKAPSVAHAVVAVQDNCIYLHGGVTSPKSGASPEAETFKYDANTNKWSRVATSGPPISHTSAYFEADNRTFNFVGGWDGRNRSSAIHSFDSLQSMWLTTPVPVEGFPVGGGLSSHSLSEMEDGGAIIIGRLGGLRTQRQTSAVLELRGRRMAVSRRYQVAVPLADGGFVMHGGEDFGGINLSASEPRNDLLVWRPPAVRRRRGTSVHGRKNNLLVAQDTVDEMIGWEFLNCADCPNLTGHSAVAIDDKVFMFGGFDKSWKPNTTMYELKINRPDN